MNADRQPSPDSDHEFPSLEGLKKQLRQLPQPRPPEDLEAKLLAAIPPVAAMASIARPRMWRWFTAAGTAAVAALLMCLLLPRGEAPKAARKPSPLSGSSRDDSATRLVIINCLKETDPCDILPPLPDWR